MQILIQTPHPWRGIAQRPHHLARRMAGAGHTVQWVEPRYLRWLLQRPAGFFAAQRETPLPTLHVRPVTLINGERFAPIRAHNRHWTAQALRAVPVAPGPRVLWLYDPHHGYLADRIEHDLLIYDIMDEYRGFPWSPPRIAEEEAALLARADWVFAGTCALFDAKRPQAEGRIECILSGVDAAHFAAPAAPDPAVASLRSRYRRLAGYAGMIDLRLDQELLTAAARALPDWGFVLVGPVRCPVQTLDALPNIHRVGAREYPQLPGCYQQWDVALLPFVENELTRHINPTKMLEYAATGRPIVARALPDVQRCYADGAWLYETPETFIEHLRTLDADPPGARRMAAAGRWAAERDWDALSGRMLGRVESLLAAKGCHA